MNTTVMNTVELFRDVFPPNLGPVVMEHRTCSFYWTCGICRRTFPPQLTLCYFQDDTLKLRSCVKHEAHKQKDK